MSQWIIGLILIMIILAGNGVNASQQPVTTTTMYINNQPTEQCKNVRSITPSSCINGLQIKQIDIDTIQIKGKNIFMQWIAPDLFPLNYASMSPVIKIGNLIVEKNPVNLGSGDIIIFSTKDGQVVHRVQNITGNCFYTQGDYNLEPDNICITRDEIVGRVIGTLYGGSPVC